MSEKIVQLNEEVIKGQIKELVRGSVEETLNELLEQEASMLTQAARYERNEARQGYRSGTALCRAANIRMSMWTVSTCGATGAESTKMLQFWWQSQ